MELLSLPTLLVATVSIIVGYSFSSINVSQSPGQSKTTIDENLIRYRLAGSNGPSDLLTHGFIPTSCGSNLSVHYTDPSTFGKDTGSASNPIVILTHGYPESSYIWRDVTPSISSRVPVFVPDQPGYGLSTACCIGTECAYDKRTYANAILEAVRSVYGDVHVVLAGHDRGARTMHRAAVDNNFTGIIALGLFVADIVPFVVEYASFSNPFWAQNYFHWSLLPKGQFATDLIMSYGGDNFVHQLLTWGSGTNSTATERFKANNAWQIYTQFFSQLSVTNASVFDYVAGATIDYDLEKTDQENGRKVKIPTHVMYSEYNLGSAFDVQKAWEEYVDESAGLEVVGIGGGRGHFIVEEGPDETIEQLSAFLDRLGVAA